MSERPVIVIAGAGCIGRATGLLLAEWGGLDVEIVLADADAEVAGEAAKWIRHGSEGTPAVRAVAMPADGAGGDRSEDFERVLSSADVLLDCLPAAKAPHAARLARAHRLHYANLTEAVAGIREVERIAEGADRGFLLQTGLAPGFANVLGHELFLDFCREQGVDEVHCLRIRAGALPKQALPPHYYGFTWSPVGVATQYLGEAIVVREGVRTTRPSLSEIATIRLGNLVLEEALTSGGAADLPDALAGRVRLLDYKSLRHPGHFSWTRRLISGMDERHGTSGDRAERLEEAMRREIPLVEDDQVVIFASVEGVDRRGVRRRRDELLVVRPRRVGRHTLRAIQLTTAAALAESARLLLEQQPRGVVLQSAIEPEGWLGGPFVRRAFFGDQ